MCRTPRTDFSFITHPNSLFNTLLLLTLLAMVLTPWQVVWGAVSGASANMQKSVPKNFFFTENKGQWDSRVLYKCEAKNGLTWFLERDGITLLTMKEDRSQPPIVDEFERDLPELMRKHPARYPMKGHALKFKFVQSSNAKQAPTTASALAQSVEAAGELSWHNNYFLGDDSSKWAPDCRNFTSVIYREVWSGIDIEWYESNGQLEFDFVVHPGFDPNQIRMSCEGLEGELSFADNDPVRGNAASRAASRTTVGNFSDRTSNHFVDHSVNFVGDEYTIAKSANHYPVVGTGTPACTNSDQNERHAGVPVATKSSTGGMLRLLTSIGELRTGLPSVYQISANGSRCELSGQFQLTSPNTFGISLPEQYDPNHTLRIDPLVFSTYLGGRGDDVASDICSDATGEVIITGVTASTNFPRTTGTLDSTYNGSEDCFVTKLNSAGSALVFSTYLGGSQSDYFSAITKDGQGGFLLAGQSKSFNFPTTTNAFQRTYGGGGNVAGDCIVGRLNGSGNVLIFSTYVGGSAPDVGYAIVSDESSGCYVTGSSLSSNFPTTSGAYDTSYNGGASIGDCFVFHLNNTGSQLLFSTFLGGRNYDLGTAIKCVQSLGVFIIGQTASNDFPITLGAFDTSYTYDSLHGGASCFISRLDTTGSRLIFSTFFGDSGYTSVSSLFVDSTGFIIIGGSSSCRTLPMTQSSFDTTYNGGSSDCFISEFDSIGSTLLYSTFLGGAADDRLSDMFMLNNSVIVFTGLSMSTNFPVTPNAYCQSYQGGSNLLYYGDAIVSCIDIRNNRLHYSSYFGSTGDEWGFAIAKANENRFIIAGSTNSLHFPTTPGAFDSTYNYGSIDFAEDAFVACFSIDTSSIAPEPFSPPSIFSLYPAFPNPFNSTTTIRYSLPNASNIELKLFDISGREVQILESGWKPGGQHQYRLDSKELASGTYFVRMQAGEFVKTQKMVLLK